MTETKTELPPIYVLVYNYSYDSGHYSPDWDERPAHDDYGYFPTREEAEAKAEELNRYQDIYDARMAERKRSNERNRVDFEKRQEAWDTLEAKGLVASQFMAKPKLVSTAVPEYEEWLKTFVKEEYYSVEEVEYRG